MYEEVDERRDMNIINTKLIIKKKKRREGRYGRLDWWLSLSLKQVFEKYKERKKYLLIAYMDQGVVRSEEGSR